MSVPLQILIVTDSFPPVCGGSGWSTWELVRGLAGRGHHVEVVKIEIGRPRAIVEGRHESFHVTTFRVPAPNVPVIRNLVKNERLWRDLTTYLSARLRDGRFDLVHTQHVMGTVPAIRAGAATGTPVVATVRDYWPVCYWSDLIYDPSQPKLCPGCSAGMMTQCVRPRAGGASVAAWSLIPYMRANLRTKRQTLSQADAIIAVSSTIADDLRTRAPELAMSSLYTIPNPIDMSALDAAYHSSPRLLDEPYILYVGKLATNKGVQYLLPAIERSGLARPVVVVGDGPLRETLAAEAKAKGLDLRIEGWLDRSQVWAWMRHASVLAFPSYGPESLSRVLIEAAALGVPIAAMDTGGTKDILHHRTTALLSTDPEGLGRDLGELGHDDRLRARLAAAARHDVHGRFSATSVVGQIELVYRQLIQPDAA